LKNVNRVKMTLPNQYNQTHIEQKSALYVANGKTKSATLYGWKTLQSRFKDVISGECLRMPSAIN